MSDLWVVNASPLILLGKIAQLSLIARLSPRFVIPQAVVTEILAGPVDDAARQYLLSNELEVVQVAPDPRVLAWDLGAGETAVLSHALHHATAKAIIDDGAARRCAQTLSISVAGTLAIIIAARQKELVPAATPLLKVLVERGYRIDERLLERVLMETVNESWS